MWGSLRSVEHPLDKYLSAVRVETCMPHRRITQHSFRIVLEGGEWEWGLHAYGVSPHRHATQYDLTDEHARLKLATSLRSIADELAGRLSPDAVKERYPAIANGQTWEDRPLF